MRNWTSDRARYLQRDWQLLDRHMRLKVCAWIDKSFADFSKFWHVRSRSRLLKVSCDRVDRCRIRLVVSAAEYTNEYSVLSCFCCCGERPSNDLKRADSVFCSKSDWFRFSMTNEISVLERGLKFALTQGYNSGLQLQYRICWTSQLNCDTLVGSSRKGVMPCINWFWSFLHFQRQLD